MIELNRTPVASTPMRFSTDSSPLFLDDLRHREDLGDRLNRDLGLFENCAVSSRVPFPMR